MIDPSASQPIETEPFPLSDFSGGITDYYLGGPLNRYEVADNLLIIKHGDVGKLFTRPGSEIYNETYYQIPAGVQRIGTLKYLNTTLFYHSARKLNYVSSGWQTLQGPTGNDLLPTGADTTTVLSMSPWGKHLFVTSSDLLQRVQKIYQDGSAVWKLRTAGMPALATSPTLTPGTPGTTFSYLYRFLYKYTYVVGTVTFVDRGPTTEVAVTNTTAIAAGAGNTIAITVIPAIANSTTHNYDTASASLKVEIYRTSDFGQNFFLVDTVNNGTTVYNDTMEDATLIDREPLYTESGAPENDPPPLCKVLHVVDDRGLFGHCSVGGEVLTNRIYQSIPGDIDSVPATFYVDVPDEVVGISSFRSNPVAFCSESAHRLEGSYDAIGSGFIRPVVVAETSGCVSSQGIVQTPLGIFWPGLDGFYWTDAFQSMRISDFDKTYVELVSSAAKKRRIQGKYDVKKNRVYWTTQAATDATDNDVIYVLDLNWGLSEAMPFTTLSGGVNFAPTAIEFVTNQLVRGDSRGYAFLHRDTLYVDPVVDTAAVPTAWTSATLMYQLKTVATNFGTTQLRKWVPRVGVICENETNLSLQISSINDDGRIAGDCKPIRYRGILVWGDPDIYWGDPDIIWNSQGIIDEQRRFPAGGLRCQFKQLNLTNAFVAIISSDLIGNATITSASHILTLDDAVSYDWPSLAVGYYVAFEQDGYVREYEITARTDDTLTLDDPSTTIATGSQAWVIRGYPKGDILYLNELVMHYAVFGKTQQAFRKTGTGEVGAVDE